MHNLEKNVNLAKGRINYQTNLTKKLKNIISKNDIDIVVSYIEKIRENRFDQDFKRKLKS